MSDLDMREVDAVIRVLPDSQVKRMLAALRARVAELEATLERVRQASRDQRETDEWFLRAARKEAADARDELWKALVKRESWSVPEGYELVCLTCGWSNGRHRGDCAMLAASQQAKEAGQ